MFIPSAYAQTAGAAAAPSGWASFLVNVGPLLMLFVAAWFLLIRPQQQRAKQQAATIGAVKKGDQVVTAGGIVGRVTKVEDRHVELEIAPNTRVRVIKATLADVISSTAKPAND